MTVWSQSPKARALVTSFKEETEPDVNTIPGRTITIYFLI